MWGHGSRVRNLFAQNLTWSGLILSATVLYGRKPIFAVGLRFPAARLKPCPSLPTEASFALPGRASRPSPTRAMRAPARGRECPQGKSALHGQSWRSFAPLDSRGGCSHVIYTNREHWLGTGRAAPCYFPSSPAGGFALAENFSISARPFLARSMSAGWVATRR